MFIYKDCEDCVITEKDQFFMDLFPLIIHVNPDKIVYD